MNISDDSYFASLIACVQFLDEDISKVDFRFEHNSDYWT